jgi:hypothetical protein
MYTVDQIKNKLCNALYKLEEVEALPASVNPPYIGQIFFLQPTKELFIVNEKYEFQKFTVSDSEVIDTIIYFDEEAQIQVTTP